MRWPRRVKQTTIRNTLPFQKTSTLETKMHEPQHQRNRTEESDHPVYSEFNTLLIKFIDKYDMRDEK